MNWYPNVAGLLVLALWSCAHAPNRASRPAEPPTLAPAFAQLIAAVTSHDWNEAYNSLPVAQRQTLGSARAYADLKSSADYVLLAISDTSMQPMGHESWWLISGCGAYNYKATRVSLWTDTEALWDEGRWAFTGPFIRVPLDGAPDACDPSGQGP